MTATKKLQQKIKQLKKKKNAVLLGHIYQIPDIQDIADYLGDSLGLSQEAARVKADMIVFCGVHFMAETAAILNPEKKVLIPDPDAGCPMAAMITPAQLQKIKDEHPGVPVLCYVNSTAATKALSDICVTSANAVRIAKALPDRSLILVPDKYLGQYVGRQTGKTMILHPGYCPIHLKISPDMLLEARKEHPGAVIMVHPECIPETQDLADYVLSTSQMVTKAEELPDTDFIIGTEQGINYTLKQKMPAKNFYPVNPQPTCPNMKKITLEKIVTALEDEVHQVTVEPAIADKARVSIEKMLSMS